MRVHASRWVKKSPNEGGSGYKITNRSQHSHLGVVFFLRIGGLVGVLCNYFCFLLTIKDSHWHVPSWREQRKSPPQWLQSCRSLQLAFLGGRVCKHHRDSWQTSCWWQWWWWWFLRISMMMTMVCFCREHYDVKMSTWWGSRPDGHSWTQEHWNRMIMISTMPTKWFIKHLERCGVKKTPDMGPLKKVKKNNTWGGASWDRRWAGPQEQTCPQPALK